ncbi:hypothetical protein [Lacipirellula parvula]|jgi:hypothetical protein|uniref:Metallothionein n=1 Tax=Lacipirellula parvula TaxID=2650471 RepID=A0A5K7XE35_9BACT|nr:hypothetical protein [Lacipirellula parvula]BBO35040.1 hypothetical protein PLANPX_4652 [Lacipirellula parvula]
MSKFMFAAVAALATSALGLTAGVNAAEEAKTAACCCGDNCKCEECGCADGKCTDCQCDACGCEDCNCGDSCGK